VGCKGEVLKPISATTDYHHGEVEREKGESSGRGSTETLDLMQNFRTLCSES